MSGQRVVIAGGTGFLGLALARRLTGSGLDVVVLGRRSPGGTHAGRFVAWDGRSIGAWAAEIDGAAAVVNLAGRSVDCVKSPDHCDEILRSRVDSTWAIGQAVRLAGAPPPVWVQMSTAHAYGDPPEAVCDETSAFGYGLAPTVARAWEQAYDDACPHGVRRVILRTSFVIARTGGAITKLERLARLGLGGHTGHGCQGMSWIHAHDMNNVFERAIHDPTMQGAYVATAPTPVSNREFMRELRRAIGMRFGVPAPAPLVRIGAPLILRTDPELALYGRYCVPTRLLAEGFRFEFPTIRAAFDDLYGRS